VALLYQRARPWRRIPACLACARQAVIAAARSRHETLIPKPSAPRTSSTPGNTGCRGASSRMRPVAVAYSSGSASLRCRADTTMCYGGAAAWRSRRRLRRGRLRGKDTAGFHVAVQGGTRGAGIDRLARATDAVCNIGRGARDIQRRGGIEQDDVTRRTRRTIQHAQQHPARLRRVLDLEVAAGGHGDAEVLRMDLVLAHLAVAQFADQGGRAQRDLRSEERRG